MSLIKLRVQRRFLLLGATSKAAGQCKCNANGPPDLLPRMESHIIFILASLLHTRAEGWLCCRGLMRYSSKLRIELHTLYDKASTYNFLQRMTSSKVCTSLQLWTSHYFISKVLFFLFLSSRASNLLRNYEKDRLVKYL